MKRNQQNDWWSSGTRGGCIEFYSYRCTQSPEVCHSYAHTLFCSSPHRDINFRINPSQTIWRAQGTICDSRLMKAGLDQCEKAFCGGGLNMSALSVWFDCKSKIVWLLNTIVCVDGSDGLLAGWWASLFQTDASQQLLEHLPWKLVQTSTVPS